MRRFAGLLPHGGQVLDLACGGGRHTRLLLDAGHRVVAVDVDASGLGDLAGHPRLEIVEVDLEAAGAEPAVEAAGAEPAAARGFGGAALRGRRFDGVVVTNYLHRPLLAGLVAAVAPGGLLIYETFARGNERFGRPTNPAFLLEPGELLDAVRGRLRVLAYEDLTVDEPRPAAVQRICARRET